MYLNALNPNADCERLNYSIIQNKQKADKRFFVYALCPRTNSMAFQVRITDGHIDKDIFTL